MLKIYHNPRCSKSRAALLFMQAKGLEFEIVEYLKENVSKEQLEKLLAKLGYSPSQLVRRGEDEYKVNGLKGASEEQIFAALLEYPKLIERPIIEAEDKAVIARPLESLVEFLENEND